MFLRMLNVKAIERQKESYILVIDNKYEKMGESLYWINEDAFNIIKHMDGTRTFDDLIPVMTGGNDHLREEATENLEKFINKLRDEYGIRIIETKVAQKIEIPILGNGKTQYPSAISVEITHRCNARCLHCYGDYSADKQFTDNTEGIITLLKDARAAGTRVVEFTGGEATCHPKFGEILTEAYNLGYNLISILSNGLAWSNEIFNIVVENAPRTVVQIDLHGDNDQYVNWFMGTSIPNITQRVKTNILNLHKAGVFLRVVTMVTPNNINQIENIADWVHSNDIEKYGISVITPMGRADLEDSNNLLLKTERDAEGIAKVINRINDKYGRGFLYEVKDGDSKLNNCGAFTSNPSITPDGNIKFCAMDDETILKPVGNVFKKNIGELYTEEYELLNLVRSIKAPVYNSEECKDCDKKYFCSYCIIRGLYSAREKEFRDCQWYKNKIPDSFRGYIL